ncbi:MAG: hypothetical protein HYZ49_08785 [Chloroflexi bacterium]|nr:hypothetical protein [Chloroflexota bacterium]
MADISAIFGILLSLGIVFPGMLTAWWLLFPATVERARLRLDRTPWLCFFVGGVITAVVAIPAVILFAIPNGLVNFFGWALVFLALGIASLGAAGIAAKMGERLARRSEGLSSAGAFVRGAVALELAAAFPVVGWVIVIPLAIVVSLGATAFALLRWMPKVVAPQPAPENMNVSQA